jgi:hypothetical protein
VQREQKSTRVPITAKCKSPWRAIIPLGLLTACQGAPETTTTTTTALSVTAAIETISHPNGHTFQFFAPNGGPPAVGESGPIGSPSELDGSAMAGHKISEIYTMVTGKQPPAALLQSEQSQPPANSQPLPAATAGAAGKGPQFYTAADTQWFQSTFCTNPIDECWIGGYWAAGSYGNHTGRGYVAHAQNGSEAAASRYAHEDYWNGSSWVTFASVMVNPGIWWQLNGGNQGAPSCSDGNWYFRGGIQDNGAGFATVAFQDHVYSKGGGSETLACTWYCPTRGGCRWTCGPAGHFCGESCSCSPSGIGTLYAGDIALCSNDSCCNPP